MATYSFPTATQLKNLINGSDNQDASTVYQVNQKSTLTIQATAPTGIPTMADIYRLVVGANTLYVVDSQTNPTQWVTLAGNYTLPTASTTVLGGVKVDGTTITIDASGRISSVNNNNKYLADSSQLYGTLVNGNTIPLIIPPTPTNTITQSQFAPDNSTINLSSAITGAVQGDNIVIFGSQTTSTPPVLFYATGQYNIIGGATPSYQLTNLRTDSSGTIIGGASISNATVYLATPTVNFIYQANPPSNSPEQQFVRNQFVVSTSTNELWIYISSNPAGSRWVSLGRAGGSSSANYLPRYDFAYACETNNANPFLGTLIENNATQKGTATITLANPYPATSEVDNIAITWTGSAPIGFGDGTSVVAFESTGLFNLTTTVLNKSGSNWSITGAVNSNATVPAGTYTLDIIGVQNNTSLQTLSDTNFTEPTFSSTGLTVASISSNSITLNTGITTELAVGDFINGSGTAGTTTLQVINIFGNNDISIEFNSNPSTTFAIGSTVYKLSSALNGAFLVFDNISKRWTNRQLGSTAPFDIISWVANNRDLYLENER